MISGTIISVLLSNTLVDNKIDFALVFSVKNANPNGDPLNGNIPRMTLDGHGELSDVLRPVVHELRAIVELIADVEAGFHLEGLFPERIVLVVEL